MKLRHRNGTQIETQDGQERLLERLYGNALGRMLLKPLTAPTVSKLGGWLLSTKASCVLIEPFIKKQGIDMMQFENKKYQSYNDFFTRKIKETAREVDYEPLHLISPCDSRLTVLPISDDCMLTIKNTRYTVASLLRDKKLAKKFEGGYALIFRLCVDDYHRYCYVADGTKTSNRFIPGVLHTVNPIANDYFPIYKENSREYTLLHSEAFGDMLMMEVGALLVGKIVNHHEKAQVRRGQEKGYFQFGGSTIVLLLKADAAQIDEDILKNSKEGFETKVKLGEKIAAVK